MQNKFVDVVFPVPVNHPFTYLLPESLSEAVQIGCRVIAPFGARRLTGFIIGIKQRTDLNEVREIHDLLDDEPIFSEEIIKLAQWMSEYYLCSLGEILKITVPNVFFTSSKRKVTVLTTQAEEVARQLEKSAPRQAQILRYLAKSGTISIPGLRKRLGAKNFWHSLNELQKRGLVEIVHTMPESRTHKKMEKFAILNLENEIKEQIAHLKQKAPKQAAVLEYLSGKKAPVRLSEIYQHTGIGSRSLMSLAERNLIRIEKKEIFRDYYQNMEIKTPPKIVLNREQQAALDTINESIETGQFKTFLLHGVTGSGKTQVYIEAIYRVLKKGKTAIVLVPEIALTPQIVQRFRSHFKAQVAVLHSAMSDGERFDSWRRLKSGEARVAVGPRSAIFAPLKNIGLIVVDEEQENSYKQTDKTPRYHAREVAIMRARFNEAVVVLGSATPSIESYFNAKTGKYHLLELTRRIEDVPMPKVEIIDLKKERRLSGKKEEPILSRLLRQKIEEKLARREQIILLLNRRGFSSFIKCKDCGYIEECKNCNITLTYHLRGRRLRCHYCNYTKRAPEVCPFCQGVDIIFRGLGTQKVEQYLKENFPQARVVRMDLDTTRQKFSHDRILQAFEEGKYDILLGTQMIAKGLDFHRVTLVGVINADVGLLVPDFRSTERTFQLLTQVAGRAGRKHLQGEVIIQTYSPTDSCLLCAKEHNFHRFFYNEIAQRRELSYPPYSRLISLLFFGEKERRVMEAAYNYASVINKFKGPYTVLGPTPAPILRIQNKYRWRIILKSHRHKDPQGKKVREAIHQAEKLYHENFKTRGVKTIIDVDPVILI